MDKPPFILRLTRRLRHEISQMRKAATDACTTMYYEFGIEKYPVLARAAQKIISPVPRTYTDTYIHEEPTADYIGAPTVSHHHDAYIVATYPVDAHVQKSNLTFLYFHPRHMACSYYSSFAEMHTFYYTPFEDYIYTCATIRNAILYDYDTLLERNYSFDTENGEIYIFWMQLPRFIKKMAAKNPRLREKLFVWNMEQLSIPRYQIDARRQYTASNYPKVLTHSPSNLRFLPPGSIVLPYRRDPREVAKLQACSAGAFEYDVAFVGDANERRGNVLRALEARGIKIIHLTNTYGDARDELIGKAKILLNVQWSKAHAIYPHQRCDRWMFAGKLIVSNECLDQDQLDVHANVVFAPHDRLVDKVEEMLADFDRFQHEYTNNDLEKIARERDMYWHCFVENAQFSNLPTN